MSLSGESPDEEYLSEKSASRSCIDNLFPVTKIFEPTEMKGRKEGDQ